MVFHAAAIDVHDREWRQLRPKIDSALRAEGALGMSQSSSSHTDAPAQMPRVTVVITTKNRSDVLPNAIRSCQEQDVPVNVLVVDDASTDGSPDLVRREFPWVHLVENKESRGYIVRRNEGAKFATTEFVISIDDDAIFSTPHVVRQSLAFFDKPWVGAVMIPHKDIIGGKEMATFGHAPDSNDVYLVPSYIGCAHMVRRQQFCDLGGYPEDYIHWGEEAVYCRKLINKGFLIRVAVCDPIHHKPHSLGRHGPRNVFIYRNRVLGVLREAPLRYLPLELGRLCASLGRDYLKLPEERKYIRTGLWHGMRDAFKSPGRRSPLSGRGYKLFRFLRKHRMVSMTKLKQQFPGLAVG
jgi:GT2 family glycosyltransferase